MTATTVPTTTTLGVPARTTALWRTGLRSGVLAALATTAVAGAGSVAGVPLDVDGEAIPLAGFAQLTLVCTAIGVLLAKALARWPARPRRTFTAATVVLTAASLVPDLAVSATTATRVVLVATHLVAAAIVIPALGGRLDDGPGR